MEIHYLSVGNPIGWAQYIDHGVFDDPPNTWNKYFSGWCDIFDWSCIDRRGRPLDVGKSFARSSSDHFLFNTHRGDLHLWPHRHRGSVAFFN